MKNFFNTAIFFFALIQFGYSQDTKTASASKNKYEAYLNYQFQYLTSATSSFKSNFTRSSHPFNEAYEIGDVVYFYRDYYKANHRFKSNISIQGGISNSKSLLGKVNFYYGIGFNYQDINYDNTIDTTTLAVRKGTVIQLGEEVQPTLFEYETLVDESSELSSLLGSSYKAKNLIVFNLHLPFGIQTKLSNKINLKTGISLNVPIWSEVTLENKQRIIFFPGPNTQAAVEKNNSSIFFNNVSYLADFEITYKLFERINLTVNYSHGLNSYMQDLSKTDYESSFANVGQVNLRSAGIGLSYEL